MLAPVFGDTEAEPKAEPEAAFAAVDVAIVTLVPIDIAEEVSVVVGDTIRRVCEYDTFGSRFCAIGCHHRCCSFRNRGNNS
jgi:hypothetical protein